MIARSREIKNITAKIGKYYFPHSGEPEPMKIYNYAEFVRSKNIIDILHQIQVTAYQTRNGQKRLNIYFRSTLEAILLHVDNTGQYDVKFQQQKE